MRTFRSAIPIPAIVLLLLPALYVGSYFALVTPNCRVIYGSITSNSSAIVVEHYRLPGGSCGRIFWPLEQIDRKLRPGAWSVLQEDEDLGPFLRQPTP